MIGTVALCSVVASHCERVCVVRIALLFPASLVSPSVHGESGQCTQKRRKKRSGGAVGDFTVFCQFRAVAAQARGAAVDHLLGAREEEPTLCASHGHVQQATFLLHFLTRGRVNVRQDIQLWDRHTPPPQQPRSASNNTQHAHTRTHHNNVTSHQMASNLLHIRWHQTTMPLQKNSAVTPRRSMARERTYSHVTLHSGGNSHVTLHSGVT